MVEQLADPTAEAILFALDQRAKGHRARILGIRGFCEAVNDPERNEMGIYDDLLVREIGGRVERFRASTDPGWKWIQHPQNPKGCAQLQCGLWWYELGWHKGNPALVQADKVAVNRLDSKGRMVGQETGEFGIHIHSGGSEYTVGSFSAGCQVTFVPEGAWGKTWHQFFDPIAEAILPWSSQDRALFQKAVDLHVRIPYVLTDRLPALPV